MELSDLARAVVRRWWIVVAALLMGIAISLGSIALAQPIYQSSVGFFVVAPTADRLSALEADNLVRGRITSYASLVTSDRFLDQIVAATGDGITKQEAAKSISAFGDPTTLILTVEVKNADSAQSLALATAISTHFGPMVNSLEGKAATTDAQTVLNVVSGPTLASSPVEPRKSLILGLGVLLGLAVGVGVSVAIQRGDRTIRRVEHLAQVTPLPVLVAMPKDKVAGEAALMMLPRSNSVLDEAARRLRTSVQFHPRSQDLQLLAVTAAQSGDGTTTTSLILAKAISESDRRVLLMEANLRMPEIAGKLNLAPRPGLTEVLSGKHDIGSAIQKTSNSNLDILVAGEPTDRPAELLGGGVSDLLEELRGMYDFIVIDTAALGAWTDAAVVSAAADGTIVVVRHGRTTPAMIDATLLSLGSVRADVLGTILNAHPTKRSQGHQGSGRHEARAARASREAPSDAEFVTAPPVVDAERRESGNKL